MNKDKIIYIDIDKIQVNPSNPVNHPRHDIDRMVGILDDYGCRPPILVKTMDDGSNQLVDGELRLLAGQQSTKLTQLPTINCNDWTEEQILAYSVISRNTAQWQGFEEQKLDDLLNQLKDTDFPMDMLGFDEMPNFDSDNQGESVDDFEADDTYTKKITAPIYEPKNEKPSLSELCNQDKTDSLIDEIRSSNIPKDEQQFLIESAKRHTVFNYQLIADYYAHSNKETQDLMEKSALVIIDFKKAIENGYVKLSEEIAQQYLKDYPDDET